MKSMRIAIGSTRPPKIEAVKEAWSVFSSCLLAGPDDAVDFSGYDVQSNRSEMPLNAQELMEGARSRAETLILQLKREKAEADFYIGLEGGFNVVSGKGPRPHVFLESWAYVSDGFQGFFGHGGGITVPVRLSQPVIERGIELGIAIDRFCNESDVRSKQGTWGILTRDIISRRHSFVIALIAAFAPFYNTEAYG